MDKYTTEQAIRDAREVILSGGDHMLALIDLGCPTERTLAQLTLALVGWERADVVVGVAFLEMYGYEHE